MLHIFGTQNTPTEFLYVCHYIDHRQGGLISLWLYKEKKTSYGIEKMYLLYIFPP
jgi:hypothetical protein